MHLYTPSVFSITIFFFPLFYKLLICRHCLSSWDRKREKNCIREGDKKNDLCVYVCVLVIEERIIYCSMCYCFHPTPFFCFHFIIFILFLPCLVKLLSLYCFFYNYLYSDLIFAFFR
jgi:hypothetical protein